jgi:hypothetical protein
MRKYFQLSPTPSGLMLAGVVIAKRRPDRRLDILGREEEIHALLSAACGRAVSPDIIGCLKRASHWYAKVSDVDLRYAAYPCFPSPHQPKRSPGEQFPAIAMLTMSVALTGLNAMDEAGEGRLLKMQEHVRKRLLPSALLKVWGLPAWKELTKDADDDSEDDSDDSDEGDSSDNSDSSDDFDSEHPRWPAGSPGGIGGEFKPKDDSNATATLHDAISQDAQNSAALNPNAVWNAIDNAASLASTSLPTTTNTSNASPPQWPDEDGSMLVSGTCGYRSNRQRRGNGCGVTHKGRFGTPI